MQGCVSDVYPMKDGRLVQSSPLDEAIRETGVRFEQFLDLCAVVINYGCEQLVHGGSCRERQVTRYRTIILNLMYSTKRAIVHPPGVWPCAVASPGNEPVCKSSRSPRSGSGRRGGEA
jgi:hypothetical protein